MCPTHWLIYPKNPFKITPITAYLNALAKKTINVNHLKLYRNTPAINVKGSPIRGTHDKSKVYAPYVSKNAFAFFIFTVER